MTVRHWFFFRHFEKRRHPFLAAPVPLRLLSVFPAARRWQAARIIRLDRELRLSERGLAQARECAHTLPAFLASFGAHVEHVFLSPARRAGDSAWAVRSCWPQALAVIDERLREMHPGVRFGRRHADVCRSFPAYEAAVEKRGYLYVPAPGGECHAARRDEDVRTFLSDLTELEGDIAVFTHAGIIECVRQLVTGASDAATLERLAAGKVLPCGGILVCAYAPRQGKVALVSEEYFLCEPPL